MAEPAGSVMAESDERLAAMNVDPATIPAEVLEVYRRAVDGDELKPNPREVVRPVPTVGGGVSRGGHDGSRGRQTRRPGPPAKALEGLTPRELVDLLHPREEWR